MRRNLNQLRLSRPSRQNATDAMDLLKQMRCLESKNGDQINVIDCTKVISAISKSGHNLAPQMALSVLNGMVDLYKKGNKAIRPDVFVYTSVINAFARRGDVDGASKVFKMQVDDYKQSNNTDAQPNIFTYNAMMDAWAKSGRDDAVDAAEKLFSVVKQLYKNGELEDGPNVVSYNTLIDCWSKSGRNESPARAIYYLNEMKDLWIEPGVRTYDRVIDAHAKQGDVDGALKVFEMMQGEVKPTLQSYSILMDAWAKSGRSDAPAEAMKLLMTIKDLHVAGEIGSPDTINFTTAMDAHAKQSDVDGALKVFEMMEGEGKPTIRSYNILMDAWAKSGRSDAPAEAMKLLMTVKDLHAAGQIDAPTTITYNSAMDAHAKHGDVDGALKVFEMMQGEIKPTIRSYSILMDAWSKSGRSDAPAEAMKLLMTVKDLHAAGQIDAPDTITYNSAMDAHAKHGDVDGALKVFEMMQGEIKPTIRSYSIVLDAWAKSERVEAPAEAMKLLITVKDLHAADKIEAPNNILYNDVMASYYKQGNVDGALKVYKMMLDDVVSGNTDAKASILTFTTLIGAWARSDQPAAPAEAMKLFEYAQALYRRGDLEAPTGRTYSKTMDAQAKHGQVDGAVKVFKKMEDDFLFGNVDTKPDIVHYNNLLDAWAESGRPNAPEQAETLLKNIEMLYTKGDLADPPNMKTFGVLHKCWHLSGRKDKQAIVRMAQLTRIIGKYERKGEQM